MFAWQIGFISFGLRRDGNGFQIRTRPFREILPSKIFLTPSSIFHSQPRRSRTRTHARKYTRASSTRWRRCIITIFRGVPLCVGQLVQQCRVFLNNPKQALFFRNNLLWFVPKLWKIYLAGNLRNIWIFRVFGSLKFYRTLWIFKILCSCKV